MENKTIIWDAMDEYESYMAELEECVDAGTISDYSGMVQEYCVDDFDTLLFDISNLADKYIVCAKVGHWNGDSFGISVTDDIRKTVYRLLEDCDILTVSVEVFGDGGLAVCGSHHDGTVWASISGITNVYYNNFIEKRNEWMFDEDDSRDEMTMAIDIITNYPQKISKLGQAMMP